MNLLNTASLINRLRARPEINSRRIHGDAGFILASLRLSLIAFVIFAHFFLFNSVSADITGKPRIIDGDTLVISNQRIRLHGIDAPEAKQICLRNDAEWKCGLDATSALAAVISTNVVTCVKRDVDRYGRLIAVCYSGGLEGTDIGEWMVREGWALSYRRYSTDYIGKEEEALAERSGLWSGQFVKPWEWRQGKRLTPTVKEKEPHLQEGIDQKVCCRICRKGKACGNTCISRLAKCHKLIGCACNDD